MGTMLIMLLMEIVPEEMQVSVVLVSPKYVFRKIALKFSITLKLKYAMIRVTQHGFLLKMRFRQCHVMPSKGHHGSRAFEVLRSHDKCWIFFSQLNFAFSVYWNIYSWQ